jgi:hypothetical protein
LNIYKGAGNIAFPGVVTVWTIVSAPVFYCPHSLGTLPLKYAVAARFFLSLPAEIQFEGSLASDCGQRSRELCEKTAGRRVEICRRGLRFYEEYGKIERLCGLFRRGSGKLEESGTWNRNEENFPVR